ncbi:hypothetical protein JVT61DRAFT_7996 [Boletus reticuloceps]|uniref:Protein-S-isoprenylcysteine O-methyltransferase n=1 Tax=Boletus reticuloceps TaxID=495285 RepID=A0A8I3A5C7_9AGAM|nr:hypothetical protein JVT61DRAFT_7996 [Boletus reticuloceps]
MHTQSILPEPHRHRSSIMYIAGLNLPRSPFQWPEVLVVLSTADYFRGGRIRPESMPSTFLGRFITPIHGLAIFIPPLVYVGALTLNRFQQPEWMARFAFSTEMIDATQRSALRVVACAASFALRSFSDGTFRHLGDQWHAIGRREKSRVVKTGPFAWVRHPGYSSVLLQEGIVVYHVLVIHTHRSTWYHSSCVRNQDADRGMCLCFISGLHADRSL